MHILINNYFFIYLTIVQLIVIGHWTMDTKTIPSIKTLKGSLSALLSFVIGQSGNGRRLLLIGIDGSENSTNSFNWTLKNLVR